MYGLDDADLAVAPGPRLRRLEDGLAAGDALRVASREEARALFAGVDVDRDVDRRRGRVRGGVYAVEQALQLGGAPLGEDFKREGLAPRRRGGCGCRGASPSRLKLSLIHI